MKNLVYTVATNKKIIDQFDILYKTFIKHNDSNADLLLITSSKEAPEIKKKYPEIKIIEENNPNKLVLYHYCEYRYNIFDYIDQNNYLNNYDKFFYTDADVIFIDKISLFFNQINDDKFYVWNRKSYSELELNYNAKTTVSISCALCESINDEIRNFILKNNVQKLFSGNFGFAKNSNISKNILNKVKFKLKDIKEYTTDNAMLNTVVVQVLFENNNPNLIKYLNFLSIPPFNYKNALLHFVHPAMEKGLPVDKLEAMKIIYNKFNNE
jgi:hypothetical protein